MNSPWSLVLMVGGVVIIAGGAFFLLAPAPDSGTEETGLFSGASSTETQNTQSIPTGHEEGAGVSTHIELDASSNSSNQGASNPSPNTSTSGGSSQTQIPPTQPPPTQPPPATPAPEPTPAPKTHDVRIQGFAFSPASLTIRAGDTVRFTNFDSVGHTATASGGSFDTGLLSQGQSGNVTLSQKGTFGYFCAPHPGMTGTITVQ